MVVDYKIQRERSKSERKESVIKEKVNINIPIEALTSSDCFIKMNSPILKARDSHFPVPSTLQHRSGFDRSVRQTMVDTGRQNPRELPT